MRGAWWVALGVSVAAPLGASAALPSFGSDMRRVEADVLAAFNFARSQPAAYLQTLSTYRSYFRADLVRLPGAAVPIQTSEGVVPVDEAIAFFKEQEPVEQLQSSLMLRLGAADHLAEQARTGAVGHYDADGSDPGDRVTRHGGGSNVAEVIAYGASDPADVIRQLIVDDGVPDRGHRVVMMADHLRYAGVACGPHPRFGTMCVIDLSDTADGSFPASDGGAGR